MGLFFLSVLFCTFFICQQTYAANVLELNTKMCLEQYGLTVGDLGFSTISDQVRAHYPFPHIQTFPEDKRNCTMACIMQKQGIITKEGTLTTRLEVPNDPDKPVNLLERLGPLCGAENDACKLAGCLYSIWETHTKI